MILVNGRQHDNISARDRALHYGDGLFETFAVKDGQVLAWSRHISRLQTGCARLGIECPDVSVLQQEARLLSKDKKHAVLKLIVSRGVGDRGYAIPEKAQITRVFSVHAWPDYPSAFQQTGIEAGISEMKLGCNPVLAGIKHLNRLEQVLLKKELSNTVYSEAIVMDIDDKVISGIMCNVFLVKNKIISTPDLRNSGINGIIRESVLDLAGSLKLENEVKIHELEEVLDADEVFFCNSVAGIWPVNKIIDRTFEVGPLTRELQQYLVAENLIVMT